MTRDQFLARDLGENGAGSYLGPLWDRLARMLTTTLDVCQQLNYFCLRIIQMVDSIAQELYHLMVTFVSPG